MRTRSEIEELASEAARAPGWDESKNLGRDQCELLELQLEVLLDIRDLLKAKPEGSADK